MAGKSDGPWYRASKGGWFVTVDGRQVNLRVKGEGRRAEAVKAWHGLMAGGTAPVAAVAHEPKPPSLTVTVAEVIDRYLEHQATRVKAETLRWLERWLVPFAGRHGRTPAADLTPDVLERFARRPGWRPNTQVHATRTVHAAFRWAVRQRLLLADPLQGVEAPMSESRGADAVVSEAEYQRLVPAAKPEFVPLLKALWLTGARPGELAGLTCDMVGDRIPLRVHKTARKGKARVLYLSPEAVAHFKGHAKGRSGRLFTNRYGRGWTADAIVKAMQATCQRAGVRHLTAYGFRHGYATQALARGIPDATVAALLGHADTDMLHKHYSHLTSRSDVLMQAAAKVRG